MTEATISVRPVAIVGNRFTDGESMFETQNHEPTPAWAIFIDTADGTTSGLAPSREAAITAANKMAEQHGWRVIHIAPESEGEAEGRGTLQ